MKKCIIIKLSTDYGLGAMRRDFSYHKIMTSFTECMMICTEVIEKMVV